MLRDEMGGAIDLNEPAPDNREPSGIQELASHREALGASAPTIGLFVFDCADAETLRKTLGRIPEPVWDWLSEVVVVVAPQPDGDSVGGALRSLAGTHQVLIHRLPRDSGFGGARKAAFEYGLRKGFDHVVFIRGDGVHPPEALPELLAPIHVDFARVVTASRMLSGRKSLRTGMPLLRWLIHVLATGIENRILGLRLGDYDTGYRVYSCRAIERIRFQLNNNDRQFDIQILIQLRALQFPIEEVTVLPAWSEFDHEDRGIGNALKSCGTALEYRLHQLHVVRRGRYFVDEDIHYTLKLSRTGSHMQVVAAIDPGRRVLDLGCSQGLLSRPLKEKNVRVVGVDAGAGERLAEELEAYYQRDLDSVLDLPLGREFDYVVISDVIEHLRNRHQLLVGSRRFLKEGGRLIISTPNIALWFYRLSLFVGRFEYGPRGVLDQTHVHLFTRATFRREVEGAGFHVVHERVTALPFEVVFRSTGRSRLIRSISGLYHALARAWPELFAYQIILEAEITTLDEESTSR